MTESHSQTGWVFISDFSWDGRHTGGKNSFIRIAFHLKYDQNHISRFVYSMNTVRLISVTR